MKKKTYLRKFHISPPQTYFPGQLSSISHEGTLYYFRLMHATFGEIQTTAAGSHASSAHMHNLYHAIVYTQGENRINYNGNLTEVKPGTTIFTSPGERHCFSPLDTGETVYHEITFEFLSNRSRPLCVAWNQLLEILFGIETTHFKNVVQKDIQAIRTFENILETVFYLFEKSNAAQALSASEILGQIGEFALNSSPTNTSEEYPLEKVRLYLERHLSEKISLQELCDLTGFSQGYLCRAFRKEYGTPPLAWQLSRRIHAAASLLESSSLSLREISDKLGFSDAYYFSKMFKREYGHPPGAHRKILKIL